MLVAKVIPSLIDIKSYANKWSTVPNTNNLYKNLAFGSIIGV